MPFVGSKLMLGRYWKTRLHEAAQMMMELTSEVRWEDRRTIMPGLGSGLVAVTMNSGVWNLDFGRFVGVH